MGHSSGCWEDQNAKMYVGMGWICSQGFREGWGLWDLGKNMFALHLRSENLSERKCLTDSLVSRALGLKCTKPLAPCSEPHKRGLVVHST